MVRMFLLMFSVLAMNANLWGASVTNVRGLQWDGSNFVDIYYDLEAADGETFEVKVGIEGQNGSVKVSHLKGAVGKGISPGKDLHVEWDAGADWAGKNGQLKAVVTATKEEKSTGQVKKVQLWEGGPYWADRNIGAEAPWDSGDYFWWGDTVGHSSSSGFSFTTDNTPTCYSSLPKMMSEGWITAENVLSLKHDAAYVRCGSGWRMPMVEEFENLVNNCDWTWMTINGVNGFVVRGKGNYVSASIFLPSSGAIAGTSIYSGGSYWSSVANSSVKYTSFAIGFSKSKVSITQQYRNWGLPIRPVQGFTK